MRWVSIPATLVAVAMPALACSDGGSIPVEPPGLAAEITPLAPTPGTWSVEVRVPSGANCINRSGSTPVTPSGGDYIVNESYCTILVEASGLTGGVVLTQRCQDKGGNAHPKLDCETKGTGARWKTLFKVPLVNGENGRNWAVPSFGQSVGHRYVFRAKGSGLKNARDIPPFNVSRPGLSGPPAVADPGFSVPANAQLTVGAPGLLNNDDLGNPEGALDQFGGGDLGGNPADNAAGTTFPNAKGTGDLTVNADGSLTLTATNSSGTLVFFYVLRNSQGQSTAQVTITITAPV